MWDFARGGEPGANTDPMSVLETPHVLPVKFARDMFELGRFFAQALYYKISGRILTEDESIGVTLFTNSTAGEAKDAIDMMDDMLVWTVPPPANRKLDPLFAIGERYFEDTKTLYFAGGRRGSFMWIGVAGKGNERLMRIPDSHWWRGDGVSLNKGGAQ